MRDPFSGIRLKLTRARKETKLLRAEFATFLSADPKPYRGSSEFNVATRILTIRTHAAKHPDPMWGVRVGEVVHNLRSALDHVVWELVILTTGREPSPGSKNQFPIFKTEKGEQAFDGRGVRVHLQCVGQDAVALIKRHQPFGTREGAKSPLWHLQELSNADKHRTLHLTAVNLGAVKIQLPPKLEDFSFEFVETSGPGPIQHDAILCRARIIGKTLTIPFANLDINGELSVNIAFDKATPAVGLCDVGGTLLSVEARVTKVLAAIASDIFKTIL